MHPTKKSLIKILLLGLLLVSCTSSENHPAVMSQTLVAPTASSTPFLPTPTEPVSMVGLPNPASAYCVQQGGTSEIRTDSEGGQYGVCIFQDGSECDEWAYFRGECSPGGTLAALTRERHPRYWNEEYGFSFDPPSSWEVAVNTDYAIFTRPGYKLFVGYQLANEDPKPFRTGMPEGDFVDAGSAFLLEQEVPKQILVFEGKNKVVAYNGRIKVGDLILVLYLDAIGSDSTSYQDLDIPQEIITETDQIIATFALISGEIPEIEFNP